MDAVVGRRVLLSGVVPGPRGIVAGQSGVVSSFFVRVTCRECPIPANRMAAGLRGGVQ